MKSQKKMVNKRLVAFLALALIVGVNGYDAFGMRGHRKAKGENYTKVQNNNGRKNSGTVGAPLDGGILTILLGGAGVAYFARKKKKAQ